MSTAIKKGRLYILVLERFFNGSMRSIPTSEWIHGCKTANRRLNVPSWINQYLTEKTCKNGKVP